METQRAKLVNQTRAHSAPTPLHFSCLNKRKKEDVVGFIWFYFRLLKMSAAAAATMTMTAAPIAKYVVTGIALVGGWIAGLGDSEAVGIVVEVGAMVVVGAGVTTAAGDVAGPTARKVVA
jgi:hypothetical protein